MTADPRTLAEQKLRDRAHLARLAGLTTDFYALPQPAQDALYGIAADLDDAADALRDLLAWAEQARDGLEWTKRGARICDLQWAEMNGGFDLDALLASFPGRENE